MSIGKPIKTQNTQGDTPQLSFCIKTDLAENYLSPVDCFIYPGKGSSINDDYRGGGVNQMHITQKTRREFIPNADVDNCIYFMLQYCALHTNFSQIADIAYYLNLISPFAG